MEVILLEKIRNCGDMGEKVRVKPGFARNYLIPNEKAVRATAENIAEFEQHRAELKAKADKLLAEAKTRAEKLSGGTVSISAMASEEGKLYGSISARDIHDAMAKINHKVEAHEVLLPEGNLRYVGEYDIELELHTDVKVPFKVIITAQQ